jgi:hypothetical protein
VPGLLRCGDLGWTVNDIVFMVMVFNKWNDVVLNALDPDNQELELLSNEEIDDLIDKSENEQESVKNRLMEGVIERLKGTDKEDYVHINQAMLIRQLDKLHTFQHSKNWSQKVNFFYESVIRHVQNTLDFIEDLFSDYFDRNKKVPIAYLHSSLDELCLKLKIVQNKFKVSETISPELAQIVCDNFYEFCERKRFGVTYNQLKYQKDLMAELVTTGTLDSERNLIEALFFFNFNYEPFLDYLCDTIKREIEPLAIKEKIRSLLF